MSRNLLIDDRTLHAFVGDMLEQIGQTSFKEHSHNCYHCGLPIRYPIIASQQDLNDFKVIMESAYKVMDKHGITANLLADIKAQCIIEMARRNSREKPQ